MINFLSTWFGVMFALVASPGPANIVLAATGAKQGVQRSLGLVLGIDIVFIVKSIIVGFGLAEIFHRYPLFLVAVQWMGVIYLLWLAWLFCTTQPDHDSPDQATIGFTEGVILQLLNAKGWLLVALMFSLFSQPAYELWGSYSTTILIIMLATLNISLHTIWVLLGATLGALNNSNTFEKRMNRCFAVSLILTAIWMGWTGIE